MRIILPAEIYKYINYTNHPCWYTDPQHLSGYIILSSYSNILAIPALVLNN
jgi:hypothetical protein